MVPNYHNFSVPLPYDLILWINLLLSFRPVAGSLYFVTISLQAIYQNDMIVVVKNSFYDQLFLYASYPRWIPLEFILRQLNSIDRTSYILKMYNSWLLEHNGWGVFINTMNRKNSIREILLRYGVHGNNNSALLSKHNGVSLLLVNQYYW